MRLQYLSRIGLIGLCILLLGPQGANADNVQPFLTYGQVVEIGAGVDPDTSLLLNDDVPLSLGTGLDYEWAYGSALPGLRLRSTDCDGGGTDCNVMLVTDGTDDVAFSGNVELVNNSRVVFDTDGDSYIEALSDDDVRLYVGGVVKWRLTSGLNRFEDATRIVDNENLGFGTGQEYWGKYDAIDTQFEFFSTDVNGSGGNGRIFVVQDGTDEVDFTGGITIGDGIANSASLRSAHVVIDCGDDPYTVPAAAHHITVETDTGTCTGNMDVVLPAVACTPASSQDACRELTVVRIGTVQVDIDGNGAETINGAANVSLTTSYGSARLLETNSSSTSWTLR